MEMSEEMFLTKKNANKFNKKHLQGGMKNTKNEISPNKLHEK